MAIPAYGSVLDEHQTLIESYNSSPPSGVLRCKLDILLWGKSTNLFCFFTNLENNEKYRLSVFFNTDYTPRKGLVSFKTAELGTNYYITVKESKAGKLPTFVKAEICESVNKIDC